MGELQNPKALVTTSSIVLLVIVTILAGMFLWQRSVKSANNVQAGTQGKNPILKHISPNEAHVVVQEHAGNPNFVILDVRTAKEFQAGHLEHAVHLDFYAQNFRDELQKFDKDRIYLVYCHSGGRSNSTLKLMGKFGFTHVYDLKNGIVGWNSGKFQIVK